MVSSSLMILESDKSIIKRMNNGRIYVEQEKLKLTFPQFQIVQSDGGMKCKGKLKSNSGRIYTIEIYRLENYPYDIPFVRIHDLENNPHQYGDERICYIKDESWRPDCSLAFVISKVAIYINKHDYYLKYNKWPGSDAHNN